MYAPTRKATLLVGAAHAHTPAVAGAVTGSSFAQKVVETGVRLAQQAECRKPVHYPGGGSQ